MPAARNHTFYISAVSRSGVIRDQCVLHRHTAIDVIENAAPLHCIGATARGVGVSQDRAIHQDDVASVVVNPAALG